MDERAAWDRFWSYDRLSSFGTGPGAGNYGEAIAAGWRSFFQSLPAGARVLDLCTGNGAIAVMAIEAGDRLRVTGADLASIRPTAFVSNRRQLKQIQFLGRTPAEELPMDAASFDAVVSQFGVEYSVLERSIPEAVRVLAPGGRLRIATHAAEGSVAADTRRAIADADFLLEEIDLPARASACFQAVLAAEHGRAQGPLAEIAAQARYAAFRDGLDAVAGRVPTAADAAMLTAVHRALTGLFQARQGQVEAVLQTKIAEQRIEVEAHRARQRALLAAALSTGQIATLARRLGGLGMTEINLAEQRDGGDLVGHVIEAVRLVE